MSRLSRNRRAGNQVMAQINVVPYIDVMLVLLIIFMITTPLLETGVEVDLPQTVAEPVEYKGGAPLVVTVARDGGYFIDYDEYSRESVDGQRLLALVAAIYKRNAKLQVLVRGDRATEYGRVVEVMVMLQSVGIAKVGLLTESPEES
ncbi:MAG: protein TolR [Gammaproteobacteria bacterium]|nr:MAG: protein TolR [Gammaproteobacteria bacterium]RLA16015.1 MAG: protein TolR [Gammaproteobacteria bacterium]RLA16419.1 MAG: protein TolR [Gammaproteobacteria bacterium]